MKQFFVCVENIPGGILVEAENVWDCVVTVNALLGFPWVVVEEVKRTPDMLELALHSKDGDKSVFVMRKLTSSLSVGLRGAQYYSVEADGGISLEETIRSIVDVVPSADKRLADMLIEYVSEWVSEGETNDTAKGA